MSHLITAKTVQPGDVIMMTSARTYTVHSVERKKLVNYGYKTVAILETSDGRKRMDADVIYHRA